VNQQHYHGIVIAEALREPRLINDLGDYRAEISDEGMPIDYKGSVGRWHLYWIEADERRSRVSRSRRGMAGTHTSGEATGSSSYSTMRGSMSPDGTNHRGPLR